MAKLFANSGDIDWMQHSAASDLGLHCFANYPLQVSRLQWVKQGFKIFQVFLGNVIKMKGSQI